MFEKEIKSLIELGKEKREFLRENFRGYFISAMLAGAYVGFGVLLSGTVGAYLDGTDFEKIVMGLAFPIALSLVVMGKAELFTSTTFILGLSSMYKEIEWKQSIKGWVVCYLGNWAGAFILALLFVGTGAMDGAVGKYIAEWSESKTHYTAIQLLSKGILCNMLVCLVTWCTNKMKSETAKLIIIFWCLFALLTSGFEHSIANMTTLTLGIFKNHGFNILLGGYLHNLIWVTLGNVLGGVIFIALPYYLIANRK